MKDFFGSLLICYTHNIMTRPELLSFFPDDPPPDQMVQTYQDFALELEYGDYNSALSYKDTLERQQIGVFRDSDSLGYHKARVIFLHSELQLVAATAPIGPKDLQIHLAHQRSMILGSRELELKANNPYLRMTRLDFEIGRLLARSGKESPVDVDKVRILPLVTQYYAAMGVFGSTNPYIVQSRGLVSTIVTK